MLVSAAVRTLIGLLLIHLAGSSASAWDRPGHLVVDAIAWELMSETARTRAVELLRSAPADAELGSFVLQARELFVRSGYWPDVVRDEAFPARKEKYDRPTWHYVNHFWRDGDLLPEMGTNGDLIHQLGALRAAAPDPVALAWLMHLVGDVHQPLHSSARVTALEPQGDRGGNDFVLDDEESWGTLHGYWDGILSRARRNHDGESDDAWVARVSREIMILHPRASLDAELAVDSFEKWSEIGAELAMTYAYPAYLVRGTKPPRRYQEEVQKISERQIALAGYRLAALMNELFD
jgi:hypothetical protein